MLYSICPLDENDVSLPKWPLFRYWKSGTIEAAERRCYQRVAFFIQLAGVAGLAIMHKSARTGFHQQF